MQKGPPFLEHTGGHRTERPRGEQIDLLVCVRPVVLVLLRALLPVRWRLLTGGEPPARLQVAQCRLGTGEPRLQSFDIGHAGAQPRELDAVSSKAWQAQPEVAVANRAHVYRF